MAPRTKPPLSSRSSAHRSALEHLRDIQNDNPKVGTLIAFQTLRVQKTKAKYLDLKAKLEAKAAIPTGKDVALDSHSLEQIQKVEMAHGAYLEARTSLREMIALAKNLMIKTKAPET
jgi:hypothetical protein